MLSHFLVIYKVKKDTIEYDVSISLIVNVFTVIFSFALMFVYSTVIDADKITVLENGKVMEQGSHQELYSAKGRYFQMWEKQMPSCFFRETDQISFV
ncbi:hypothetical protein FACS189426_10720 [Bacteroidia bacterium]|nr:hypothetical protein FACS189426_10720 [Bacteroidia bacterium]GHT86740.1 hypothetical protein FACS18947_6790 [Bacteroidia bacterium]